jgi:serine protease inhibitor
MSNLTRRASAFALAAGAAACSNSTEIKGPPSPLTSLPRALTSAERSVSTAGNEFSLRLFQQINADHSQKNVFVSPLSASMALGMTLNGAAAGTFDAMRTTLAFGAATQQTINEGYKGLIDLLSGLDKSTTFQLANSIWYRQDFHFEQPFLDAGKTYFGADVRGLDFAATQAALAAINGWVNTKTNGKIPTIVDQIAQQDVMFLINAIYFKGSWRERFDPAETHDGTFRTSGGTTQTVKLMHRGGHDNKLRYFSTPEYQVADLPYGNDAWTMTILLPSENKSVDDVIAALTPQQWESITSGLAERTGMDLYLPKFKLTWERTLNDDLTALGMGVAFDANAANFSHMSPEQLFITKVKQKSFVDVNEEGTEAAAATSVGIGVTSLPPQFRVDHPFVFVIRERLSGTILFIGKVGEVPPA